MLEPMKISSLMFLCLLAWTAPAQTNQNWTIYRHPIRIFANRSVNLTPLFQWWARQPTNAAAGDGVLPPDRPLTPWYHITGSKIATLGASWVVNAEIFTSPTIRTNEPIFLNHPPSEEESTFAALKSELPALEQQIARTQKAYAADTNAELRAGERLAEYRRSSSKSAPTRVNEYSRIMVEKRTTAAALLNQLQQLQAAQIQYQAQFEAIPAIKGAYHVDCFAIELGRNQKGVRIFDLGLLGSGP